MAFFQQVIEIGNDVINPQHIVLGKHDARVNDQNIIPVFVEDHIFSDFP
jgi:hypothetical protein